MVPNQTGPRNLLKRLRELMAEALEPQERLDRVVHQIATSMVAEVCSFYVLRADGVLELYATEGLKKDAVHQAQLKMGQGLVGVIAAHAEPLNLSDAQSHHAFRYLPETGEEIYNSFLGVPILRAGRSLGVLVIQNKDHREYGDDDVEAMETTSMVLAEMIATGELKKVTKPGLELDMTRPVSIDADAYGEGIGLGHVVLHEPRVVVTNLLNDDIDAELERLDGAVGSLRISIDDMLERRDVPMEGEHRAVLEAFRMFANDRGWVRKMEEAVRNGLTAEAAVEKVQSDTRARMINLTDPYLRERLADFDDLANRLLRQLTGFTPSALVDGLPQDAVIVARTMGAAELLDYPRENIRGLVLEEGAVTSHIVIVAKAMGVPVVSQAIGIASLSENGDPIIVDGNDGTVHLRPAIDLQDAYADKVKFFAKRQKAFSALRNVEPISRDGQACKLLMNAGLVVDLPQLKESGAAGIGLFRTELQFMISSKMPKAQEQEMFYREVLDKAGDLPVTFRVVDIGGDKVVPYLRSAEEENPALGWRAIRFSLDRPGLLQTQLRALLRATGGSELRVMIPMITELSELRDTRKLIEKETNFLKRHGYQVPEKVLFGAMLEVPSLLFQLDELMEEVDFISVGSNDLFQFITASDRGNARVADRFSPLKRPFLRVLRSIVEKADQTNTPLTLCGELAGNPLSAMALFGIGYRSISMSPAAIGPVKSMLLSLDIGKLERILLPALEETEAKMTIAEILTDFIEENGISL
ncbi:MAG: phosphoenolpyruvate--protein phosphotransferase [Lentilitoribacter sp.]